MSSYQYLRPWLNGLRQSPWRLAFGFTLMAVTAFSGIALLGVSGWFISAAAVFVVAFDIFTPGAAIRSFALLRTVARYFERVTNHDVILRIQQRWRVRLFSGLFHQPLHAIERFKLAHVLQRLTQDLNALDDLYIRILAPIGLLMVASIGLGSLLYWLTPMLGLLVWLFAAVMLAVHCGILAPRLRQRAHDELQLSEALRHQSLAFIHSKAELHAWNALPQAVAELASSADQLAQGQHQLRRHLWRLQHGVEWLGLLAVVATLALALQAAFSGGFSIPLALLAGLMVLAMQDQWLSLPQAALLWGKVTGAAQRLQPMLDAKEDNQTSLTAATNEAPSIHLNAVRLHNRDSMPNISLVIPERQITWLAGASGSGKSSVLLALIGLLPCDEGQIETTCQSRSVSLDTIKRVMLTQENAILAQSVAANLKMARTDFADDTLWAALELVELADQVEALPAGLDTWLGDGGINLSGGQQRRLALARTLLHARGAGMVLLDEPFNGVGLAQAQRIWQRILPLLDAKTVVVASHQDVFGNTVQQRIQLCYDCAP